MSMYRDKNNASWGSFPLRLIVPSFRGLACVASPLLRLPLTVFSNVNCQQLQPKWGFANTSQKHSQRGQGHGAPAEGWPGFVAADQGHGP